MKKPLKVGDRFELVIERLSFTGKGIGRLDNFVIFVPHTLPGDQVQVQVFAAKRNYAEARILQILKSSELAIPAKCRHFGICGGCSFQNLPYADQLTAKQDALTEHLKRIGGIPDPPVEKIIGAEDTFFYRNKMEFSIVPHVNEHLHLGLHHRGEWENIFDVEECLLQSEISNKIVNASREFFKTQQIPAYHLSEHVGLLRFLIVREGKNSGEAMIILVTNRGKIPGQDDFIQLITGQFPSVVSIVQSTNSSMANIAIGESEEKLWGREYLMEIISGKKFKIRPSTFFQTNSRQTEIMYGLIKRLGEFGPEERVLDLYTGCGTIALYLSDQVKSVTGVEVNDSAIQSARENAELNDITNCEFIAGDVRQMLSQLMAQKEQFQTIIIDPPRAGVGRRVIKKLIELAPQKIIYVSCNPTTLSSDLKELREGGYALDTVAPIDMFPHTFHIESVTRLTRGMEKKGS